MTRRECYRCGYRWTEPDKDPREECPKCYASELGPELDKDWPPEDEGGRRQSCHSDWSH